jgi:hypothetical protein
MQTINLNKKSDFCLSEVLMYLILICGFCMIFYKFLSKRTINIENFDSTDKITYSIDGHHVDVNENGHDLNL